MDRWEKPKREDRCRHRRQNPSFSSSLLDSIYRSIDEGNGAEGEEELIFYRESMRKKHSSGASKEEDEEMANLRRACMIEKWMEKKFSEKVIVSRKSTADSNRKLPSERDSVLLNSSSSSSESSSGGGFSSSESESFYGSRSRSSCYTVPKPIRTSISVRQERFEKPEFGTFDNYANSQKAKQETSFVKAKSKALKIYGDLKKVKQPISPGARLASFLNSLFTAGNAKKAKVSSSIGDYDDMTSSKSAHASTCSSASSFSRSCLSKTPSSRGKLSNGAKRSVRFYPVSVIVDEDCRPCGHKSLSEVEPFVAARSSELKFMDETRRVEEAARNLLMNYQKRNDEFHKRELHNSNEEFDNEVDDDDDEADDAASYSSSDLFELDNLSAIGIEELPVYETTHIDTNRAIANGLIL